MKLISTIKSLAVGITVLTAGLFTVGSVPAYATTVSNNTPSCVDGTNRANLTKVWDETTGTVTVKTVNDAPLCDDVTIFLTNYTLPSTYDGSGVYDDSALPQVLFDSNSITLLKGTNGNQTVTVKVPNACTDYQMDLYYAPEVVDVPYTGHAKLIYGRIYLHTQTNCAVGGMGGETPTPATPAVLGATTTAPVAATLTDTGLPMGALMTFAALTIAAAVTVMRLPSKKIQQ